MFTGIVEEMGALVARDAHEDHVRLRVGATITAAGLVLGESVAVNGCCLTVVESGPDWWAADVVAETLARTTLGDLAPGDPVNLERSLRVSDRFGGHLVQGHIDGVGIVRHPAPDLEVGCDPALLAYVAEKGSIAVDGVSLTVVAVLSDGFRVALIPHTMAATTLGAASVGGRVNLEVDVIAKYVERLLAAGHASAYLETSESSGGVGAMR